MPEDDPRHPPAAPPQASQAVLMALFGLWATALGAGFAVVVAVAYDRLGPARLALFVVAAAVLLPAGLRTLYELARRLRGRQA